MGAKKLCGLVQMGELAPLSYFLCSTLTIDYLNARGGLGLYGSDTFYARLCVLIEDYFYSRLTLWPARSVRGLENTQIGEKLEIRR